MPAACSCSHSCEHPSRVTQSHLSIRIYQPCLLLRMDSAVVMCIECAMELMTRRSLLSSKGENSELGIQRTQRLSRAVSDRLVWGAWQDERWETRDDNLSCGGCEAWLRRRRFLGWLGTFLLSMFFNLFFAGVCRDREGYTVCVCVCVWRGVCVCVFCMVYVYVLYSVRATSPVDLHLRAETAPPPVSVCTYK